LQRDVRTLRPGDVIIVELVAADVNRDGADSDVWVATLLTDELPAEYLLMRCIRSASCAGALTKMNVCRDMASQFASNRCCNYPR
jgi:hypothetical protein